jgi:nitrogen fixation protein NifU and related proteins
MHIHASQINPNAQLDALYAAEKASASKETERTRKKLSEFASALAGEAGEACVGLTASAIFDTQGRPLALRYNSEMYSPQLLDHFENPRNVGEVDNPDAVVQVQNPACGDILKLSVRLSNGHIADICFLAKGCVAAMACASALTELVKGKTVAAAQQLRREELVQAVGDLPEASTHASYLAMDALAAAVKKLNP